MEARERSGSLVTARHAADQGIDVFAVPGPITASNHVGCNRLIRDGAAPLLETQDVLAALAWPTAVRESARPPALSDAAREILAELRFGSASGDELTHRLARSPSALAPALVELELAGEVARDRDGRWRACVSRQRGRPARRASPQ